MPVDKELDDFAKAVFENPPCAIKPKTRSESIVDAILAVPNVQNAICTVDHLAGTLEVTVTGGDKTAIAQAINESRPLGGRTIGSTLVNISTFHGDYEICFNYRGVKNA